MSSMTSLAIATDAPFEGPTLRLLPKKGSRRRRGGHLQVLARDTRASAAERPLRSAQSSSPAPRSVLLAGGDGVQRAAVLHDLRQSMPQGTRFIQAGALWEMLAHVGESSMVVLSGELERTSAESVMQMLAHRNPTLPVVSVNPSV